ncbi:MAG: hypothetical protein WCL27_02005 [Betaproteobacteria bacterium]
MLNTRQTGPNPFDGLIDRCLSRDLKAKITSDGVYDARIERDATSVNGENERLCLGNIRRDFWLEQSLPNPSEQASFHLPPVFQFKVLLHETSSIST